MNIEHAVRHTLIIHQKFLQKQSKPQWGPAAEGEALKIFIVALSRSEPRPAFRMAAPFTSFGSPFVRCGPSIWAAGLFWVFLV